jgi:hypothetical protein
MTSNHITLINLVDDIKEKIPEGIYLQLCNELKKNKDHFDELSSNPQPIDSFYRNQLLGCIEILQGQVVEYQEERTQLLNDNLNLERDLGTMRWDKRKMEREVEKNLGKMEREIQKNLGTMKRKNMKKEMLIKKLRQENLKLREDKIKEQVDISIFEDMSDISDFDFDTDTDDEEMERFWNGE